MTFLTPATTFFLVIVSDQLTKIWIMENLAYYEVREILPGFFNLVYLTNTGVAFGLFAGESGMARLLFFAVLVITALIILIVAFLRLRSEGRLFGFAIGLIAGGAIGNFIDRIRFGAVVDFFDFHFKGYHWPAFNVADSAITVGVGLFLLAHYLKDASAESDANA